MSAVVPVLRPRLPQGQAPGADGRPGGRAIIHGAIVVVGPRLLRGLRRPLRRGRRQPPDGSAVWCHLGGDRVGDASRDRAVHPRVTWRRRGRRVQGRGRGGARRGHRRRCGRWCHGSRRAGPEGVHSSRQLTTEHRGVDLLARVEAIISHLIVKEFRIPTAHAPAVLPPPLSPSVSP